MQTGKNITIIGAGPAGLMAAEQLAQAGHAVSIYDRMPTPARKFLIAGRGGLNLTHSEPLEKFITRYGAAAEWLAPSIRAYTPDDLRAWCEGLGEETFVGSSGRVFPKSMKAVALLRAWLKRLESLGVQYYPRHTWLGWRGDALRFSKADQSTFTVSPDATVLALGGASWPRLGSDGGWVPLLAELGVEMFPLCPSNCGFTVDWSPLFKEKFAGEPLKPVVLSHEGISRQGEAMVTAQGIEGGVIYALSASLRDAIYTHGKATLRLDLRPNMTVEALAEKLSVPRANKSLSTYLRKLGFSPLTIALLREVTSAEQLAQASASSLAGRFKSIPLTLTGTTDIARAISSAGGVMREAVDAEFMLKAKPGVFVVGEMLDWEAPTGGYLLQGCFSTAVAASKGILRYCQA